MRPTLYSNLERGLVNEVSKWFSGERRSRNMKVIVDFQSVIRSRAISKKGARTCLMCGRRFRSEGPHNRRCSRCNYLIEHAREGTYYDAKVYSMLGSRSSDVLDVD